MFDCSSLPPDTQGLAAVEVELLPLADDSPASCPASIDELLDYLALEVPGGAQLTPQDLTFLRTADLGDVRYWIWWFQEPKGGEAAYATVAEDPGTSVTLGYDANEHGLSPEQFIVGEHCGYW